MRGRGGSKRGNASFAETWWGARWIQALQRLGRDWSRSLSRGRDSTGDVRDLDIKPGRIRAAVEDGEGEPFHLEIDLRILPDHAWNRVLRRLTRKALYAAKLLSGEMPRDIERVFAQCRTSLFPRRRHEVGFNCSCQGPDQPCWHVAAAHHVLAEAFDRDPFLLFELRGRSRDQVLAELREIRGARASRDRAGANALDAEDEDRRRSGPRPEDYTVAGPELATLGFHVAAPDVAVGAIRALGPPRSWPEPLPLLRAFAPIYRAAATQALEIAWSGEEEVPASAILADPESEETLAAMADAMAAPTAQAKDSPQDTRRGGRRKRRTRRRGGRGSSPAAASKAGGKGGKVAKVGGKKRRRRRGGRRRGRGRREGGGPSSNGDS
ncbi:MAG: hypothetical protein AAF628_03300 [Planctomycetota bacterium]